MRRKIKKNFFYCGFKVINGFGKGTVSQHFSHATIYFRVGIKPDEEINRRLWEEGVKFAAIDT